MVFRAFLTSVIFVVVAGCSSSDSYLPPPTDPQGAADSAQDAERTLESATYSSIGMPFGCDTDCADEEIGFREARADKLTETTQCSNRYSDKSLMSNATQDGCRAYVQALESARQALVDARTNIENRK
jgi:hypothetical protein